jgi:hypothetical protein
VQKLLGAKRESHQKTAASGREPAAVAAKCNKLQAPNTILDHLLLLLCCSYNASSRCSNFYPVFPAVAVHHYKSQLISAEFLSSSAPFFFLFAATTYFHNSSFQHNWDTNTLKELDIHKQSNLISCCLLILLQPTAAAI